MAEQTIDKLQVEIEASAKGTTAAFKQLESQLATLQKALNSLDTSKIKALNNAVKATKPSIDTSGMTTAERNIKASVDKIQQSLAGLTAYANKSLTGDKSAFSSYEKQATSLQSAIDVVKEKFRQLGSVHVQTKEFQQLEKDIADTKSHLDSLIAKQAEAMDSGGLSLTDQEMVHLGNDIDATNAKLNELVATQIRMEEAGTNVYNPYEQYVKDIDNVQGALTNMSTQVHEAMAALQNQPGGTTVLDKLSEKLSNELPTDISKLQTELAGLGSIANSAMSGDKSSFTSFERKVVSIQGEIDKLSEKMNQLEGLGTIPTDSLEAYKATVSDVNTRLQEMAGNVRNAYAQISSAGASGELDKTAKSADKASSSVRNLFSQSSSSHKLSDAIKGVANSFSRMSDAANKGFMKILKYGFGIRSVYVLFRRLRKAVVESFGELQNSGAFFETTRANIEALKSSLSTLKFQFGAAFEPIFNAVAPALETFVNYLITVMNVISAFMAKLTGKSTYSKVSATFGKVASGAGSAGKAVKELNKQLQGFDELNNLTTNNGGGGGGGGGGGAGSGGAEYVEASVDDVLGDFGKTLAEKIRQGDWEGVGKVISDKLSEAMEGIKWDDIFSKAGDFGTKLASFLNGLINPRLFQNIGTTIGNSINTGLIFFNNWGKGMNWVNVGTSLAAGFDALIQTGWIGNLGTTLHTWIAGGLTAATTFFKNADFVAVGEEIAKFIGNLDIPDLASKLYELAKSILLALGDAIKGFFESDDIGAGEKLAGAIALILGGLVLTGKLGKMAGNILTALGVDMNGKTLSIPKLAIAVAEFEIIANSVSLAFSQVADELGFSELSEEYENFASHPITYTIAGIVDIANFIKEEGFQKFADVLKEVFDPNSEFMKTLAKIMGYNPITLTIKDLLAPSMAVGNGASTGLDVFKDSTGIVDETTQNASTIRQTFAKIQGKYGSESLVHARDLVGGVLSLWGEGTSLSDSGTSILGAFKSATNANKKLTQSFKTLGNIAKGTTKRINDATVSTKGYGNATATASKEVTDSFSSVPDTMKNAVQSTTTGIETSLKLMPTKVQTSSQNAWKNIKDSFKDASTWSSTTATAITSGFNTVPSEVESKFGDAYKQGTGKFAKIYDWATYRVNDIKRGLKPLPSTVGGKFKDAYDAGTGKFNDVKTWIEGVVGQIKGEVDKTPGYFNTAFGDAKDKAYLQVAAFRDWFNQQKFEKSGKLDISTPSPQSIRNAWSEIASQWTDKHASFTIGVSASIEDFKASLNSVIAQFNANVGALVGQGIVKNFRKVDPILGHGGIVTDPTRIIAGDAGPEAVVPLANNTQWLGRMASMIVGEVSKPQYSGALASGYVAGSGGTSSDLAEQNALLKEEVQLLRRIADKDFSVSSREVFKATQEEANNYYYRTGNSPFLN